MDRQRPPLSRNLLNDRNVSTVIESEGPSTANAKLRNAREINAMRSEKADENQTVVVPNIGGPNIVVPNIGGPNIGGPNIGGPNIGGPNIGGPNVIQCDVAITSDEVRIDAMTTAKNAFIGLTMANDRATNAAVDEVTRSGKSFSAT